jgi:hypothetical protein
VLQVRVRPFPGAHRASRYAVTMAEQYVARDKRTDLEIQVTGDFPPHPDDRIRIARTTTLFTRLMSTILSTENEGDRRQGFMAIETQLELAEALIRGDAQEVQELLRRTLEKMGISQDQFEDMAKRVIEEFGDQPGASDLGLGTGPGPNPDDDGLPPDPNETGPGPNPDDDGFPPASPRV